jgi:hypothetical protein
MSQSTMQQCTREDHSGGQEHRGSKEERLCTNNVYLIPSHPQRTETVLAISCSLNEWTSVSATNTLCLCLMKTAFLPPPLKATEYSAATAAASSTSLPSPASYACHRATSATMPLKPRRYTSTKCSRLRSRRLGSRSRSIALC